VATAVLLEMQTIQTEEMLVLEEQRMRWVAMGASFCVGVIDSLLVTSSIPPIKQ